MLPEESEGRAEGSRKVLNKNLWLRDLMSSNRGRFVLWDVHSSDAFSFRGASALFWPSIFATLTQMLYNMVISSKYLGARVFRFEL